MRRSGAAIVDYFATSGWLLYPLVLFLLPNSWQLAGVGPETWIALVYLVLFAASSMLYGRPIGPLDWAVAIPAPVLLFAGIYSVGVLARGDLADAVRLLSWLAVMLLGSQLFRLDWLRLRLWRLWAATAASTALVVLLARPIPMPEVVGIFAWEHRTVLAYYLVGGLLSAVHLQSVADRRGERACAAVAATIITVALVVSLARGAWIAAFVGYVLLYRAKLGRLVKVAVLFLPVAIGVSMTFDAADDIASRFVSLVDLESASSSMYRLNLYIAAIRSLPETWLLGAPVLEHGPYLARFSPVTYPHFFSEGFATDSDVIFVILSGGLPLLGALGGSFVVMLQRARTGMKCGAPDSPMLAALLVLSATQAMFDNLFSSALGWFYLGVLCALSSSISEARDSAEPRLPAR